MKFAVGRYFVITGLFANILLFAGLALAWIYLDRSIPATLYALGGYLQGRPEAPLATVGGMIKSTFEPGVAKAGVEYRVPEFAANPDLTYPWQQYDESDKPIGAKPGYFSKLQASRIVSVSSSQKLVAAIRGAKAGDLIDIGPGVYRFDSHSIPVSVPGTRQQPVYVRANRLGSVVLEFNMLEGFHVTAPFWVFENLEIRGVCGSDSRCEHAFHVIANGRSFVLRNSVLEDFNAPLKVNGAPDGEGVKYPDQGLVEYNRVANTRPRDTGNPVTLLNINSVNNWVVRGNLVSDFSKLKSNRVSYGAFMKGNGRGGVFERNLIYCEGRVPRDEGVRIGLSLGGGGTGNQFCRDGACAAEHTDGIIRNNIILNCSKDVGIYLSKAADTRVYNNLLYNNLGIDVRFPASSARVINNVISGRVKSREGGSFEAGNNWIDRGCFSPQEAECGFDGVYKNLRGADLRLTSVDNPVWEKGGLIDDLLDDFCGNIRDGRPVDIGPIEYRQGLECLKLQQPH